MILTRYVKLCFYSNFKPDILISNRIYILLSGYCSVSQECISIKKCPYTKELFSQVKSTSNPDEKAQLIQAIRLRVCGEPSDRTVCCEIDQGKIFFLNLSLFKFFVVFPYLLICWMNISNYYQITNTFSRLAGLAFFQPI